MQAEEEGSKLSNEELTANIILLFGAGHETTVNLIGNGVLALHRNPDQLQLLQGNPSLIANAIEEFLRYDSSVQLTGRTALEPVAVAGTEVAEGETVLCLLGAANRDPAVYDDPERLDITRQNIRPLSFGGGIHFCLGAQLARIEAEIAIATLLRRLPNLSLDDADHPEWRPTFVLRGLNKLSARWSIRSPLIRTACGGCVAAADLAPRLAVAPRWEQYHTKSPGGVSRGEEAEAGCIADEYCGTKGVPTTSLRASLTLDFMSGSPGTAAERQQVSGLGHGDVPRLISQHTMVWGS